MINHHYSKNNISLYQICKHLTKKSEIYYIHFNGNGLQYHLICNNCANSEDESINDQEYITLQSYDYDDLMQEIEDNFEDLEDDIRNYGGDYFDQFNNRIDVIHSDINSLHRKTIRSQDKIKNNNNDDNKEDDDDNEKK